MVFTLIGILYVDDTNLLAYAEYTLESAEWVAQWMQDMTNHWRGSLRVTGGDLNPDKCNWSPIGFFWDEDGQWHYQRNIISTIQIPDLVGIMQILEKLGPSQATTVIGVVQAADGNMTGATVAGPQGGCWWHSRKDQ
jgi:hypothetical protein